jgi:DNA-directed RNA polymerase specialized sigma24 family protein
MMKNKEVTTIPRPSSRPVSRAQRAEIFDRRRRQGRDLAETLVSRAEHLLPEDRALLNAIYRDGSSAREIAILTGTCPRSVRLRIRKLAQRALDPRFAFVLVNRDQWPPTRRKVATEHILHGRPLRETASQLDLTLYAVRRHADAIRVMYEAIGR